MSDDKKRVGDLYGTLDIESFRELLKKATPPIASSFSAVMEVNARHQFEKAGEALLGDNIKVYQSTFMHPDEAYLIDNTLTDFRKRDVMVDFGHQLDDLIDSLMISDYSRFSGPLNFRNWTNPWIPSPKIDLEYYDWTRFDHETLGSWGQRLFEDGVLDVPEVRWEYQVAVMGAPVRWLRKLFGR